MAIDKPCLWPNNFARRKMIKAEKLTKISPNRLKSVQFFSPSRKLVTQNQAKPLGTNSIYGKKNMITTIWKYKNKIKEKKHWNRYRLRTGRSEEGEILEGESEVMERGIGFEGARNPWNGAFGDSVKEIRLKVRALLSEWLREKKLSGFNEKVLFGSQVLI